MITTMPYLHLEHHRPTLEQSEKRILLTGWSPVPLPVSGIVQDAKATDAGKEPPLPRILPLTHRDLRRF
jgi:hypothetical protein